MRRQRRRPGRAPHTIAYLHDNVEFGGIETLQVQLLHHLDPARYRGIVVVAEYAATGSTRFRERLDALGVRLLTPPVPPNVPKIRGIHTVWSLRRLLTDEQADIAHIQTRTPASSRRLTLGAFAAAAPAIVRTEHVSPGPHVGRWTPRAVKPFDWMTDLIITDSKADRREQIELVGRDAAKVVCSYCGIDSHAFDPDHDVTAAKVALGLDPAVPVVGTVGRLHVQKGHTYLVEAAAQLIVADGIDLQLLVVGDGPDEAALRAQVEAAGIAHHVHFAGFQENALPYMEAMDVVAMPSLWEGFSISMQEFMALGKPMVVSDHHSFKEAMVDGEHGVIVPMRDSSALASAISKVLGDEALRRSLGRAAADRARRAFNIQQHAAELMDHYDALLRARTAV